MPIRFSSCLVTLVYITCKHPLNSWKCYLCKVKQTSLSRASRHINLPMLDAKRKTMCLEQTPSSEFSSPVLVSLFFDYVKSEFILREDIKQGSNTHFPPRNNTTHSLMIFLLYRCRIQWKYSHILHYKLA